MSTITIRFQTQALDFSPLTRGRVRVIFNDGTQDINLDLELTTGTATVGKFKEVSWVDGVSGEDEQQASNFAFAFNRDYSFVGNILTGLPQAGNLNATYSGDTVTITATKGTFSAGSNYNGNVLTVSGFTISNSAQPNVATLSAVATTGGGCTIANHTFTASGDGAPFKVTVGTTTEVDVITSWNGTAQTVGVARSGTFTFKLYDSGDNLLDTISVYSPRKLAEGDFEITVNNYDTASDVIVERVVVIAKTSTLEYSLDASDAVTGGDYQSSNTFAGVPEGTYKLFIKDQYGCEISKNVSVTGFQDSSQTDVVRYFDIMEGQSFVFSPHVQHTSLVKKNYFNTWSYNEYVRGSKHRAVHYVDELDGFKGIQFKSSYQYHYITMNKCDGTQVDIPPIMIAQNLGAVEKFDCMIFPYSETQTGVYFNGGNEYVPDTTTVLGASDYDGTTPSWVKINQLVFLNGTGLRIKGTGYDTNRGSYFLVDLVTASETSAYVQATYNKQLYNTFEFYVNMADIDDSCVIVVEKAFDTDGLIEGNPWVSERIQKITDSDDIIYLQWSDTKNKSDIVFQSGLSCFARYKGEISPASDTESETYSGDENVYPISQTARIDFEIVIDGITFKQVNQLNIASSLGGFAANGISLVAKEAAKVDRSDVSNLWTWRRTFGYGSNQLAIQADEIVYSPTTGIEGGGGNGISETPDLSAITLIKDSSGNLIKTDAGSLLKT